MNPYVPILVIGGIAAAFAVFSIVAGELAGPRRYNRAKLDAYECGIEPTPQPVGGGRFPVKYYLTAMLFIIFDIEIIFLYPWAVSFGALGTYGLVAMIVFAAIVFISLLYEIAMGGLEWGANNRLVAPTDAEGVTQVRTSTSTIRRVPKTPAPITPESGAAA